MIKIPALKINQQGLDPDSKPVTLYITSMTLNQLKQLVKVDDWTPDTPLGYQRPVVDRRVKELSRYLEREQGIFPTSILLGTRELDSPPIEFTEGDS